MTLKVLSILALVALVFSVTATADPVDEHAIEHKIEMLKIGVVELDIEIQQVKAMRIILHKQQDELDQDTLQLEAEHQKKLQEFEALHDEIKALGKELEFLDKIVRLKKTEKEAELGEDDHVHA